MTFRELLRQLMTERGLSLRQLARRAAYDPGYLSKILNGHWEPSRPFAERLDSVLGADGRLLALIPDGSPDEPSPDNWSFDEITADAVTFALSDLAGPRRRSGPHKRVLRGPDLTEHLEHWITRPASAGSTPRGTVGLDDVERIEVGARLLRRWDSRHRLGVRRRAVVGQLAEVAELLESPQSEPVVGRLLFVLAELAKVAASMSFDAGLHPTAQHYYRLALRAAHASGQRRGRLFGAHVLALMARQQLDLGEPGDALDLVRLALDGVGDDAPPQLRAMLRTREGWAYAKAGRVQAYHRAAGLAEDAFEEATDDVPYFVRSFDRAELAGTIGARYRDLAAVRAREKTSHRELAMRSIGYISTALELRRPRQVRNRAFDLIGLGRSYLLAGERDQAVHHVREAVVICDVIRSGRAERRLRDFHDEAAAYADARVVAELRAELAARPQETA